MASTLPARLARIAKVPILAVVPKFQDGRIKIDNGIQIDLKEIRASHQEAIQNIFRFYESEICKFPSTYWVIICPSIMVNFLSAISANSSLCVTITKVCPNSSRN